MSGRKGVDNNEPANPTEDNPLTTHSTTPATTTTVKNPADKIKIENQAAGEFKRLLKEGMSSYTRIMKCPMPFSDRVPSLLEKLLSVLPVTFDSRETLSI